MFSLEFHEISKNTIFIEYLWVTASVKSTFQEIKIYRPLKFDFGFDYDNSSVFTIGRCESFSYFGENFISLL